MKLLISVTNVQEALAALAGGADIIDVKNPREGSLGASTPEVIRQVRQCVPASCELSATIGDVPNLPGTVALAALGAAVCGVDYVKVGLFGVQTLDEAVHLLRQVNQAVKDWDPVTRVIAAGYADADEIGAILPHEVPVAAAMAGVDGAMLDTARKGEGGLLTLLSLDELHHFVSACRQAGLLCALAGSLDEADLPAVQSLEADIVGFRSAVCQGDRISGRIDSQKVRRLKALLSAEPRFLRENGVLQGSRVSPGSGRGPAAPSGAPGGYR